MTNNTAVDQKYEGWTNRETWLVKLWLDNEYELYQEATFRAKRRLSLMQLSLDERLDSLAAQLRGWVVNGITYYDVRPQWSGLASDLEYGGVANVNWREIAESYLEDYFYSLVDTDVIIRSDNAFNGVVGYATRLAIDTRADAPYIFKFIVNTYKADGTKWPVMPINHELTYTELFPLSPERKRYAEADTEMNLMRITK